MVMKYLRQMGKLNPNLSFGETTLHYKHDCDMLVLDKQLIYQKYKF